MINNNEAQLTCLDGAALPTCRVSTLQIVLLIHDIFNLIVKFDIQ